MSEQIVCPKCGSTHITHINPECLDAYYDRERAENNDYFFDCEAYSTAKCWECEQEFQVVGTINWKISK